MVQNDPPGERPQPLVPDLGPPGVAPSLTLSESSLEWSLTEGSSVDLPTDPDAAMSIDLVIAWSIDLPRPST
jgi:hypothetical protein